MTSRLEVAERVWEFRPAWSSVAKELADLRGYYGLSVPRVKEYGKELMLLPATLSQIAVNRWPDDYAAQAAHDVIICALNNSLLRTDFVRVLSHTLNINGVRKLLDGRLGYGEGRRHDLCTELDVSRKAYL